MILGDILELVLDFVGQLIYEFAPRFFACVLIAVAGDVFILWLVPGMFKKAVLVIAVTLLGIVTGAIWEWRHRSHS